jgi:hypothetical protein
MVTTRSACRNDARPSQHALFTEDSQSDELKDIAIDADSSSFDEEEHLNPKALAVLDDESERHEQRRRDALLAKEDLIRQMVTVKNGNRTSPEWKVIADIDSFDEKLPPSNAPMKKSVWLESISIA